MENLISEKDLAAQLGLEIKTLRNRRYAGQLDGLFVVILKKVFYKKDKLIPTK